MNNYIPDRWKRFDAEQAVVGSMLRENGVIADVFQVLAVEDLWFPQHRLVAQAILDLYRERKPADLVTVSELLHARNQGKDTGGPAYVAELFDAAPTAVNAGYYAEIVAEAATKRNLSYALHNLLCEVHEEVITSGDLLQRAEKEIFILAARRHQQSTIPIREGVLAQASHYDELHEGRRQRGLPTGYAALDEYLAGLHKGQLVVVAARPSIGKTALATCIIRNVAAAGHPVFFASIEQPRVEITERFLAQMGGIHAQRLRTARLDGDEYDRLIETREFLAKLPIFLDDCAHQTTMRITTNARRHWLRDKIELVVIDYLQLIQAEDRKTPREEQVATIAARLKGLARELQIPVIALAQLNRGPEARPDGRPRLGDLRESGMIEAHADVVILLHRTQDFAHGGQVVDLLVEKQRNGPTGEVSLLYRKEHVRFDSLTPVVPGSF